MTQSVSIGNDLTTFYNNLVTTFNNMLPQLNVLRNVINENAQYIYIQDESENTLMDMYALNLLPNDNNIETEQVVLCNNLSITNDTIDFTTITTDNIGPCFYTYDSNGNQSTNTYWITNSLSSTITINTGDTDLDAIYKLLYTCSVNSFIFASNDDSDKEYIWVGFKSYQEQQPMFFISVTDKNNIGVFGVCDSLPTSNLINTKFLTSFSTTPESYNLYNLSINSSIVCLTNIVIPQSINHEYFTYIYLCTGKDMNNVDYIQLDYDGVEYYKLFDGTTAIVSNPKFPDNP